jgi:hypothetical protein
VVDNRLYLADFSGGIEIFLLNRAPAPVAPPTRTPVATPPAPSPTPRATPAPAAIKHVGEIGGGVQTIAVYGSIAYVGESDGLAVLDMRDLQRPALLTRLPMSMPAPSVITDAYGYVAAGYSGLQILDLRDPAAPTLVGKYDLENYEAGDEQVAGDRIYVADARGGVQILRIDDTGESPGTASPN